ncbi:hypothetical protein EAF04_002562 [Stromatinia cepivora]|nr:hypothetical protein EAF04_002562 [Stromatinia cepivora]
MDQINGLPPVSDTISDTPSASPRINTFPFHRLPIEIRSKIWKFVGNQPRNLDIWQRPLGNLGRILLFRWVTLSAVPPILHTCQESRKVGLEFYELSFGRVIELAHEMSINIEATIYVNWNKDRIFPMQKGGLDDAANAVIGDTLEPSNMTAKIQTMAVRAINHEEPELSILGAGYVDKISIYYEPFISYNRFKSRNLTIEFQEIDGLDFLFNAEKEGLEDFIDRVAEEHDLIDEEVALAWALAQFLQPREPEDNFWFIQGPKKADVRLGRIVIYGIERRSVESKYEMWTHEGWVPAETDL